ncbi:MAG: glycosyltransferase [Candidatus Aminicenantales bacterium]
MSQPMKILMLAPEPFFQPRGTPISVFFRLKALAELGHQVDLVTYHIGEDRRLPGLRIHRTPSLFFIRNIRIGPSLAKILLDLLLFARSTGLCVSEDYDLVFSHEEAAWFGVLLAKWLKVPHLYDMHSSLPQQLENFRYSRSRLIRKAFVALERFVLRNSSCVLVICQDLLRRLGKQGWGHKAVLLENYLDFPKDEVSPDRIKKERSKVASPEEKIILLTLSTPTSMT